MLTTLEFLNRAEAAHFVESGRLFPALVESANGSIAGFSVLAASLDGRLGEAALPGRTSAARFLLFAQRAAAACVLNQMRLRFIEAEPQMRRTLELTAFAGNALAHPEDRQLWREAHKGRREYRRYKDRFREVVRRELGALDGQLVKSYDAASRQSHATLESMSWALDERRTEGGETIIEVNHFDMSTGPPWRFCVSLLHAISQFYLLQDRLASRYLGPTGGARFKEAIATGVLLFESERTRLQPAIQQWRQESESLPPPDGA